MRLIWFRGHLPKGGYDVQTDGRNPQTATAARRFDEKFKEQAVRLVLDQGKSIGAAAPDLREAPAIKLAWIAAEKASFRVSELCRALTVSSSGFYARARRPPSAHTQRDEQLRVRIRASFEESKHRYGSPRIHRDLREEGEAVSRNRVIRLMQEDDLVARRRKRFKCTTMSDHHHPVPSPHVGASPNILRGQDHGVIRGMLAD
jgi:transposase-like protein